MTNNKEVLISPIEYHGPGACPECFTPMILADMEINMLELDKHGQAVNITDTMIKCQAICYRCGRVFPMMRSRGIYRPYSEAVQTLDRLDIEYETNRRNEGRYNITCNPLTLSD